MVSGVAKPFAGRTPPRVGLEPHNLIDQLGEDVEVSGVQVSGDFSRYELIEPVFVDCRLERVQLTGAKLRFARFVDCVISESDLSGAILEECSLTRVELRACRGSGMQAASGRFIDVGIIGCRMNGASFRVSSWERAELVDSDLTESDFYAAKMPASRITGCDFTRADLSRAHMAGSRLMGSNLGDTRVDDSLRNVTISTDEIVPAALALFKALRITVEDGA
jgi:uncharacterized protein YjbI with pentapeptide repeats